MGGANLPTVGVGAGHDGSRRIFEGQRRACRARWSAKIPGGADRRNVAVLTCLLTCLLELLKGGLFGRGRESLLAVSLVFACLVGWYTRASTPHSAYINHTLLFLIRARE